MGRITVALAAAALLGITACGPETGNPTDNPLIGSWTLAPDAGSECARYPEIDVTATTFRRTDQGNSDFRPLPAPPAPATFRLDGPQVTVTPEHGGPLRIDVLSPNDIVGPSDCHYVRVVAGGNEAVNQAGS